MSLMYMTFLEVFYFLHKTFFVDLYACFFFMLHVS